MHPNPGAKQSVSIGRALLLASNSLFAFNSRKERGKRAGMLSKRDTMGNDNPGDGRRETQPSLDTTNSQYVSKKHLENPHFTKDPRPSEFQSQLTSRLQLVLLSSPKSLALFSSARTLQPVLVCRSCKQRMLESLLEEKILP
jgi:hypothetical protein